MRLGDGRDVVGPLFPVAAIAALLDQSGIECFFEFADFELQVALDLVWPVVCFADRVFALAGFLFRFAF